jgi:hypothetical protein
VPAPSDVIEALSLAAPGEARRASRALHNFSGAWFAALVLFVLGIFVAVGLYSTGRGAEVLLVPVGCVMVSALLVPATVARGRTLADRQLAPLGLSITGMPGFTPIPEADGEWRLGVRGATRLGGVRHGRHVSVAVDTRSSVVELTGAFPVLRLEGTRDGLRLVEGPTGALTELAARIGDDARWRGAEVVAGPSGLAVTRPRRPSDLDPLLDLWLAERVADAAASPPVQS